MLEAARANKLYKIQESMTKHFTTNCHYFIMIRGQLAHELLYDDKYSAYIYY